MHKDNFFIDEKKPERTAAPLGPRRLAALLTLFLFAWATAAAGSVRTVKDAAARTDGEPRTSPPALQQSADGPAPGTIMVEHLEIIQTIQDSKNSVALVAGKSTLVRAYLSYLSANKVTVRGQLSITGSGSPIPSTNTLTIDPSLNGQAAQKRLSLDQSLNFILPAQATSIDGPITVVLSAVTDASSGAAVACSNCATVTLSALQFIKVPPLRVTVIGLSYGVKDIPTGITDYYAPSDVDFKMLESWLRRAYPVSQVIISKKTLPVPLGRVPPSFTCDDANILVAATRTKDIDNGSADPHTHYFGLVSDGGSGRFFMRGCAAVIPDTPNPAAVASGPAGSHVFDWDTGASYSGWYSGHELAHTFGRKHPGFCGETHDDTAATSKFIGSTNNDFIGYDVGDQALSILPSILPPTWTDIMTYCDHQWISSYTYEAIMNRIQAEDSTLTAGAAPVPGGSAVSPQSEPAPQASGGSNASGRPLPQASGDTPQANSQPNPREDPQPTPQSDGQAANAPTRSDAQKQEVQTGKFLTIVGKINITKRAGEIINPFPVSRADAQNAGQDVPRYPLVKVRAKNENGDVIGEYSLPVLLSTDKEETKAGGMYLPKEDQTGLVNGVIPYLPATAALELYLVGDDKGDTTTATLLQTIQISDKPPKVINLTLKPQAGGPGPSTPNSPLEFTWDASASESAKVTYNVELSTDDGKTWKTVAVGLTTNGLNLSFDSAGVKKILVRVTATDGLSSSVQTKKFSIK
jgi:hypothetical protein